MSELRWGLLGTARINRALIPPLQASSRNRLVAVASRDQQRAEAYAREWHIPRALGSYAALLSDPGVDVIYNSLPNHLHAEWTIKAVQAGKHVLCEKPLALSLAEVDAIQVAAQSAGRVVMEAFMYRHHPQTLKVRELVTAGELGTVRLVRGSFSFSLNRPDDIRWQPGWGGGALWDIGCYPVSYARFVLGAEPVEVFARQVLSPSGVDLTVVGQLRFPGEVFAQFDCSFGFPLRAHVEVVGDRGSLQVPAPFKPGHSETVLLGRDDQVETLTILGEALYSGEVENLADAILLDRAPRVSLADSRANTAALLALYESARLGQPVAVLA
jgi:predicted dehydrogenase